MKIYLDDERATPPGWVRAYRPSEVIALLETGQVMAVGTAATTTTEAGFPQGRRDASTIASASGTAPLISLFLIDRWRGTVVPPVDQTMLMVNHSPTLTVPAVLLSSLYVLAPIGESSGRVVLLTAGSAATAYPSHAILHCCLRD
jgi:hypothetical protein